MVKGRPLFDIFQPAFPLTTTASPIPQGALIDDFGNALVSHDDHAQTLQASFCFITVTRRGSFLLALKQVDPALHPVDGKMQERGVEGDRGRDFTSMRRNRAVGAWGWGHWPRRGDGVD